MEVQSDFKELLALFNDESVDYLIVGAYALAHHGSPRFTGDLDLYVRPSTTNAERVLRALDAFGFGGLDIGPEDFSTVDRVVQLGVAPVRIDLATSITGVTWEQAAEGRVLGTYGDVEVPFLGRDQLIQNKRAVGRQKDLSDLEALGETSEEK